MEGLFIAVKNVFQDIFKSTTKIECNAELLSIMEGKMLISLCIILK